MLATKLCARILASVRSSLSGDSDAERDTERERDVYNGYVPVHCMCIHIWPFAKTSWQTWQKFCTCGPSGFSSSLWGGTQLNSPILQGSASKPARFALVFFHTQQVGICFCIFVFAPIVACNVLWQYYLLTTFFLRHSCQTRLRRSK